MFAAAFVQHLCRFVPRQNVDRTARLSAPAPRRNVRVGALRSSYRARRWSHSKPGTGVRGQTPVGTSTPEMGRKNRSVSGRTFGPFLEKFFGRFARRCYAGPLASTISFRVTNEECRTLALRAGRRPAHRVPTSFALLWKPTCSGPALSFEISRSCHTTPSLIPVTLADGSTIVMARQKDNQPLLLLIASLPASSGS